MIRKRPRVAPRFRLGCAWACCLCLSEVALAFSQGSPVCEVLQLPLVEMSPTLSQPPPSGWLLQGDSTIYYPNELFRVRIRHGNPERAVRGVLIWARQGPTLGSGSFLLNEGAIWQYIPAPADCGQWAVSHRNAEAKTQAELVFDWRPPHAVNSILRAFLIEDCPQADCRAWQALTNLLVLEGGVFRSGFEALPPGPTTISPRDPEQSAVTPRSEQTPE